jgi:hypothetical protein
MFQQAESADWATQGDTAEAALADGLNRAADRLAQRHAPQAASSRSADRVRLRVVPVDGLRGYRRILEYLTGLNEVGDVGIALVEPGAVTYEVSPRGGRGALEQALGVGNVLQAEDRGWTPESDAAGASGESVLNYRVLP